MGNPVDLSGKVAIMAGAGADVACAGRTPAEETAARIRALGQRAAIVLADLGTIAPV